MLIAVMLILVRILAGAGFGLAVGLVAAFVIGAVFGLAVEIIFALTGPPRPPDDPDELPATFSILVGIVMALPIGAPMGLMLGAIVFPLARVRIYPGIIVGAAVGILSGMASAFTLGQIVDFPAWPGSSTMPFEIFTYGAIGLTAGSVAGVVAGNIRRIPVRGGIAPGLRR